jgi:hypothetical protein
MTLGVTDRLGMPPTWLRFGSPASRGRQDQGKICWKYVCFENHAWPQFNLNEDPYEEMNLAQLNRYRPERKKMIACLKQWGRRHRRSFRDTGRLNVPPDTPLDAAWAAIRIGCDGETAGVVAPRPVFL